MNIKWTNEYYSQLIGFKIVGFKIDGQTSQGDSGWPVLVVKKGKEKLQLVVSQDAEGNGPGFIFIENEDGQQLA